MYIMPFAERAFSLPHLGNTAGVTTGMVNDFGTRRLYIASSKSKWNLSCTCTSCISISRNEHRNDGGVLTGYCLI
jgi:hypothetical protein